jgi:hypothetical protein
MSSSCPREIRQPIRRADPTRGRGRLAPLSAARHGYAFVVVTEKDGAFTFTAPWGETMVARPGDAIVQDAQDPKDTYRVQKAAFACTYEEIRSPPK